MVPMVETIRAVKAKLKESQKVSYRLPAFEHARVSDAMRTKFFGCEAEDRLITVARLMATHHVHCVVVERLERVGDGGADWGVVSDREVVKASTDVGELTAGQMATKRAVMISPDEPLAHAAHLMVEHDTTHLVVLDPLTHRPIGVLSSLDIAGVLAWGRG